MRVELESVREQHRATQTSAKKETNTLQQQLHTTRERLTTLTAEKESEKVRNRAITAIQKHYMSFKHI